MWPAPLTQAEFKDVGIVGPENDEDNNEHWHPGQYPAAAPQPPRQSHLPAPPHLRLEDRPSRPAGAGRELLGRRLGGGKARCAALHCLAWRESTSSRCHLWGCAAQCAPSGTVGVSHSFRNRLRWGRRWLLGSPGRRAQRDCGPSPFPPLAPYPQPPTTSSELAGLGLCQK